MAPDEQTRDGAAAQSAHEAINAQLLQVSAAMVRIYKEQLGRGPERARSYYAGPDAIV